MSISKQLVELMHGTIAVESKKGVGTSVIVTLPLIPHISRTVTKGPEETLSGTLHGIRILVAEDNDINATVINSLLTREGAEVTLVVNGKELIEQAKEKQFDLIISDLQMPEMGGMEAVAWVRENLPASQRMIALTANAFAEEKERCLQAGFNDIVYKPFKKEALIKICLGEIAGETNVDNSSDKNEKRLYNLDNLADMVDHNEKQIHYLVQQFLEETPEKVKQLRQGLLDGNLAQIKKIAHYLSSSIHHLDIASLFELTTKIEHAKETKINTATTANVHMLCEGLEKVILQLKADFPKN
jgi:CheY-like chemotaxis protein